MSSLSMPAAKRRRVDAANETLKKPFRSPMVKRPQPQEGIDIAASSPATPAPAAHRRERIELTRLSTPSKIPGGRRFGPALSASVGSFGTPSRPAPNRGTDQKFGSSLDGLSDKDTEFLNKLSRRKKEAELKTREVEKEMELVRQAARIQSGKETSNEELEKLVGKWKGACRTAAEELFELIRGRVDSMGGGAAWRETRQQNPWFDEDTAEEKKTREEAGEGADDREELEGLERVEESEDGPEQDEERVSFAVVTLRILAHDPKLTTGRTSRCT